MAPRKKRSKATSKTLQKAGTSSKIILPESSLSQTDNDVAPGKTSRNVKSAITTTTKKFGKFRCLLDPEDDTNVSARESEEEANESSDTTEVENPTLPTFKNSDLKIETNAFQEDNMDISETTQSTEMESGKGNQESDVVVNMANLNFNSENSQIVEATDEQIIDNLFSVHNVQQELTVECVTEEVVPAEVEFDVELSNENSNSSENIKELVENQTKESMKSKNAKKAHQKSTTCVKSKKKTSTNVKNATKGTKIKSGNAISKSDVLENFVRRSSRIQSINVKLKTPSSGLVKCKSDAELKKASKGACSDIEVSDQSNSGQDSGKSSANNSLNFVIPNPGCESDQKPVKVKSRWRRSSELEMGNNRNSRDTTSPVSESSQSPAASVNDDKSGKVAENDKIRNRLKQFIHLKENQYLTGRVICKEAKKMVCDCFLTTEEIDRGELACGEDCLNRLLMIECGILCPLNDKCTNKRFQKSQFSPCEVFCTEKKGLGIRATADIPFGEFILEYVGEVIGPDKFEDRATEYSKGKNPHYYFMSLRSDAVIDATLKGNISRFINHSCEPNAETQKWTVNGELRIGFFSKKTILAGEEITFDYQFQRYGKDAQKCFCEAATCRGWLGEEPGEDDEEEEEDEGEEEEDEEDEDENAQQEAVIPAAVAVPIVEDETEPVKSVNKTAILTEVEVLPEQIEEEIIETKTNQTEIVNKRQTLKVEDVEIETSTTDVPAVVPTVLKEAKKATKKDKRKIIKRKVLIKDIFDDVVVDEEIEMLMTTGLKNQAHTLKLSRLMVRANEASQRTALLRILRHGELPCRRLFLDYHGLRLIHGWMNDAQQKCKTEIKQESLRLELLQTLATLPIPNKTMLQDSKVLPTVECWSVKLQDTTANLDSASNSPKIDADQNGEIETENVLNVTKTEESKHIKQGIKKDNDKNVLKSEHEEELPKKDPIEEEIRKSVGMDIEHIRSRHQWCPTSLNKLAVEDIIKMFDDDDMELSPITFNKEGIKLPEENHLDYEVEIIALALKLLEEWSVLKEVFRIPKKERIEQMKEHEREANRGYKTGLEQYSDRKARYRRSKRYRTSDKPEHHERLIKERLSKSLSKINKHERRKLFALQVEQEEVGRRLKQDMWRHHEYNCLTMVGNPRFPNPIDSTRNYQCVWNQQTGQWQMLNPRFNTPSIPYTTYNNGAAPPLPTMPPPTLLASNMSHTISPFQPPTSSMPRTPTPLHLPPTNIPPPIANIPLPSTGMPSHPTNMPPHPTNMPPHPTNMPPHPTNMPPHPTNMPPHPANMPPHPTNMPPPIHIPLPTPANIPLPPINMSRPPPNMPLNLHLPAIPSPLSNLSQIPVSNSYQTSNILPSPTVQPPSQIPLTALPDNRVKENEDVLQVKFAGPIPPPPKLPPKWKCSNDKYGRPYYYHIKLRVSQWEPPEFPLAEVEEESSETTSSSDTSSLSSDSSSEDSEVDDRTDTKLMLQIRKKFPHMDSILKINSSPKIVAEQPDISTDVLNIPKNQEQLEDTNDGSDFSNITSLDERLKEEFNLNKKDALSRETSVKQKRHGLVTQVHIISPRTDEDKMLAKENLRKYKENKQKLKRHKQSSTNSNIGNTNTNSIPNKKRVKVTIKNTSKPHKSTVKARLKEVMDLNSEVAKKIKESFRSSMAGVMVGILNPYRKPECKEGRIANTDDFKHLARKLTHFVMLKELKHCQNIEDLICTESVKAKAKEFVRKYMSKFGETYTRPKDDVEYT